MLERRLYHGIFKTFNEASPQSSSILRFLLSYLFFEIASSLRTSQRCRCTGVYSSLFERSASNLLFSNIFASLSFDNFSGSSDFCGCGPWKPAAKKEQKGDAD